MKEEMKKLIRFIPILILSVLCSCDALDLYPVDNWSLNNYWKTEEQAERFIRGLHYRLQSRMETIVLMGELRAGTLSGESVTSIGEAAYSIEAVNNNLSEANPVLTNWGNFYMDIYQINHAIDKITNECSFLSDTKRNTYLGQLYGMRAFYYFHMLRTWGGVPLCDKPDVLMTGDLKKLNKPRATELQTWKFIKDDVDESCSHYSELPFENYNAMNCFWNKAASYCLKAEVYLWGAKVTPVDGTSVLSNNPTEDLKEAEKALLAVEPLYSPNASFINAFAPTNKDANTETIFAARYVLNESSNFYGNWTYNIATFTKYFDSTGTKIGNVLNVGSGALRYEYSLPFWNSFATGDTRRDATFLQFYLKDNDNNLYPAGRSLRKFLGEVNNGKVQYTNDVPIYRYMDVALMLAEVGNALDKSDEVIIYMSKVRSRAFGSAVAYSFPGKDQAEEDILNEWKWEFVAEGKSWYAERRMAAGAHALALAGTKGKLLWPIDAGVLSKDNLVKQNDAYITAK